jgi:hypothetical protein
MGTTKSGRVINTKGSGHYPSEYALIHSSEGDFTKPRKYKKTDRLRLKGGGHSEANLNLLKKYGIKFEITGTYSNEVRIGNIPDHRKGYIRSGNNQSWFPKNWTLTDIRKAGMHVTGLKKNRHISDGISMKGTFKGVIVCVKKTRGKIATIFPDKKQNCKLYVNHKM